MMKKNIFLLSVFVLAVGCSTRKNKFINRAYHNFTAYYNTLFHGKEALKAELKSQKTGLRDNFQEGYLEVFSQNSLIPSSEEEDVDAPKSRGKSPKSDRKTLYGFRGTAEE